MLKDLFLSAWRHSLTEVRLNTHAEELAYAINFLKTDKIERESLEIFISLLSIDGKKSLMAKFPSQESLKQKVYMQFGAFLGEIPDDNLQQLIENVRELLEQELQVGQKDQDSLILKKKLERLQQEFSLSDAEIKLVQLLLIRKNSEQILKYFSHQMSNHHYAFKQIAAAATGLPEPEIQSALQPGSNLSKLKLLNENSNGMGLSPELENYLGDPGNESFGANFCQYDDCQSAFPLSSFDFLGEGLLASLKENLAKSKQLLLVGKTGAGKTSFARALVKSMGRQAIVVQLEPNGKTEDLHRNMFLSCRLAAQTNSVVIFEYCDESANRSPLEKIFSFRKSGNALPSSIFYEMINVPAIFILNNFYSIDESVLGRFDYLFRFDMLATGQRYQWFKQTINQHSLGKYISDELIGQLAANNELVIRDLAVQLDNVAISFGRKKKLGFHTVEQRLRDHLNMRLQAVEVELLKPDKIEEAVLYSPDLLNVSFGARHHYQQIENMVKSFSASKHKNGLRMVFHGLPGSGKSNFASYLAKISGRRLLVKRYSDLSSKWVGDTEKLIARAFAEAQAEGSILLIDEADSVLSSRDAHRYGWESTRLNEFLASMESFKGILICTTNRFDHLDAAVMRRFQVKAEFLPLLPENRIRLFELFFSSVSLSQEARARLGKLDGLMPGDFAVVRDNWAFGDMKETAEEIVEDLAIEVAFRQLNDNRMIGF